MQRSLRVTMNGRTVGSLAEPRTNRFTFSYDADAIEIVSARLPWTDERYPPAAVAPWVDSLAPAEPIRLELARQLDVPDHLLFRLLEACGGDLPGAIVLESSRPLPPGENRPLEADDLVDEVAAVRDGDHWVRPGAGRPSSHLIRFEDELLPGSAAAELFALTLARTSGIPTVDAELIEILGVPAVVVARPDRRIGDDGTIERRHLETFGSLCGLALEADDERIYEERGGPGFDEMAEALDKFAANPQEAIRHLVGHMVLHYCTGNTNAHAGTYSLLHPELDLGPIDTLLPAEIYTELVTDEGTFDIDHRLAMSIGGQTVSSDVTRGALIAEAASWPRLRRTSAEVEVDDAIDRIAEAVAAAAAAVPNAPERLRTLVDERIAGLRQGS